MGMDITMHEPPTPAEIREAGLDADSPDYYRFNVSGMRVMVLAMVAAGAVSERDKVPEFPAWPPKGTPKDRVDALRDAFWEEASLEVKLTDRERIQLRAVKQQHAKVLATRSARKGMVPAYKFASNEGWIVSPAECAAIALRMRAYAKRVTQKDLDALSAAYAETQAKLLAAMQRPGEHVILGKEGLGMSLDELRAWVDSWAAYNAVAAKHGGYRVE